MDWSTADDQHRILEDVFGEKGGFLNAWKSCAGALQLTHHYIPSGWQEVRDRIRNFGSKVSCTFRA